VPPVVACGRCAGTLLYALRACSRAQLRCSAVCQPKLRYVLDGDGEGQLGFTAVRRFCPAALTPLTAVTTPDTVLTPGWEARSLTDVLRLDSAELSALVWACHWPCASLTKVARAVLTLPRSAVSWLTAPVPTLTSLRLSSEVRKAAALAHRSASGDAADAEAVTDGVVPLAGVLADEVLPLDPHPAASSARPQVITASPHRAAPFAMRRFISGRLPCGIRTHLTLLGPFPARGPAGGRPEFVSSPRPRRRAAVPAVSGSVPLPWLPMMLLAAFTSLRWAELTALRPEDIDLDARTVLVTRQLYYHGAGYSFGPPKSQADVRVVDFPELIVPDVRAHLDWLPVSAGLVFANSTGSPLAHCNFRRRVWLPALTAVGLEAFTFTTCGTLATSSPPMRAPIPRNSWPGWDTTASVPRSSTCTRLYLHSSAARQRALADAVGEAARAELAKSKARKTANRSGTRVARNRRSSGEAGR
jgi:hypothetical protein